MQVALVKCGGANFGSVQYALERLGVTAIVTDDDFAGCGYGTSSNGSNNST